MLRLFKAVTSFFMSDLPEVKLPEKQHHFSIVYNTATTDVNIAYSKISGLDKVTQHIMDTIGIHDNCDLYVKLYAEINKPSSHDSSVDLIYNGVNHVVNLNKRRIFLY